MFIAGMVLGVGSVFDVRPCATPLTRIRGVSVDALATRVVSVSVGGVVVTEPVALTIAGSGRMVPIKLE